MKPAIVIFLFILSAGLLARWYRRFRSSRRAGREVVAEIEMFLCSLTPEEVEEILGDHYRGEP